MIAIFIGVTIVVITIIYFKAKYNMSYWKRLGIPEETGYFPFGSQSSWDTFTRKKAFIEMTDAPYINHPGEKLVGTYDFLGKPSIVLRDPELIKLVLVKDFDHFTERLTLGVAGSKSKNNKHFAKMLSELRGKEWKKVRASLTPIFTSGKLKAMVPLIHKVADAGNWFLDQNCGKDLEGKDFMEYFALDVIVSTGFGFECNSFEDPTNAFKKNGDLMFGKTMDYKMVFILFLIVTAPSLISWFDLPVFNKKATDFFVNLILYSIKERKKDGIRRNDLIDLVNDALSKDETTKDFQTGTTPENKTIETAKRMTEEEIEDILIANSLLMFLAGLNTVSSTASVTIYCLAKNQDIQKRLYEEISAAVEEHGSENLGFTEIMKLQYLDMVFLESQRFYPITHLERRCTKEYKVPGMSLVIPKDMMIRIPMPAIVRDEAYYANPAEFNPENFNEENKAKRHAYVTGAFGHGPRNCIALRFATLEVKLAIARIVHQFKILPCGKTVESLVPDPKSRTFEPKGGLWFTVEKRE